LRERERPTDYDEDHDQRGDRKHGTVRAGATNERLED